MDHLTPLTWHAHPAAERPGHAVLALVLIAAIALAVFLTTGGGVAWGLLSAVVLVLALNRFFMPSRFEIDEAGITARHPLRTQRLAWPNVRRFVHDERGGYLSTRARPSRLDASRGMHILFGSKREDVIAAIRARLPRREEDA